MHLKILKIAEIVAPCDAPYVMRHHKELMEKWLRLLSYWILISLQVI